MKKKLMMLLLLSVGIFKGFTQSNIHYYGWDAAYSHAPTDIIETQGGFFIIGDVQSSQPLVENPIFKKYLVRTNSNGDTVWTRYHAQDYYGGENVIQASSGEFLLLGCTSAGYVCTFGSTVPFSDYYLQTISPIGDSITFNQFNVNCTDDFRDFEKNADGSLTTLAYSQDFNGNSFYSIKELNTAGNLSTIPIATNYMVQIQKAKNGYWIAGNKMLYKVTSNGITQWQNPIKYTPDDFCKASNDSLVFASSSADSVHVVKTDSSGKTSWDKKYFLHAYNILSYSSDGYILTGKQDTCVKVIALNPNGDSIWGKKYSLKMPAWGIKTIETQNGGIATLAFSGGYGLPSQYVLILDTINTLSGVNENAFRQKTEVFPNPTGGKFTIKNWELGITKYDLEIYNVLGEKVYQSEISNQKTVIDISNQPNGVYFLQIKTDQGSTTKKIIISK